MSAIASPTAPTESRGLERNIESGSLPKNLVGDSRFQAIYPLLSGVSNLEPGSIIIEEPQLIRARFATVLEFKQIVNQKLCGEIRIVTAGRLISIGNKLLSGPHEARQVSLEAIVNGIQARTNLYEEKAGSIERLLFDFSRNKMIVSRAWLFFAVNVAAKSNSSGRGNG